MSYINTVVIEKNNLLNNINVVKNKAQGVKIIAVVKGNSYGMGNNIVPKVLLENGIDTFAVCDIDEALELKKNGINSYILILNSTGVYEEVKTIIQNGFIATIGSIDTFDKYVSVSNELSKDIRVHLKIDTGFSRFGFLATDIIHDEVFRKELFERINNNSHIRIEGIYTHFQQSYDKKTNRTFEQFELFSKIVDVFKEKGFNNILYHACNTFAFFKYPQMHLNAVRIGSAFTGRIVIADEFGLKRVGYLSSKVCEIKRLGKGSKVGYSGTCKLKHDTNVAIVEAGYFDGVYVSGPKDSLKVLYKFKYSLKELLNLCKDENKYAYINGKKYRILGRVGMKNFVLDIMDDSISVGDEVRTNINMVLTNQKLPRVLK